MADAAKPSRSCVFLLSAFTFSQLASGPWIGISTLIGSTAPPPSAHSPNRERFFGAHVFGGMLKQWPEGFRERKEPLMKAALAEVPAIFAELPLEWLHVDGDESLPVQLDMKRVISALELPFTDPETFWKLP